MDFSFTEDHQMLREMARKFADKELRPRAMQVDLDGEVEKEVIDKMAEIGFMGLLFPEKYLLQGAIGIGVTLDMDTIRFAY